MNAVVNDAHAQLRAWLQQALSYQRAGQPVEASQYYLLVVGAKPDYWEAYYNLGICFQAMDQHAQARNAYRRVTQLNPNFAEAYNNLGNTLKALKQADEAESAYQRALTLKPGLAEASYNMALVQQAKGRFADSVKSLEQAVASNPKKDDAWDALYRAQLALKRQEEAIATFLAWEAAVGESPLLTAAGLAQSRFLGDRVREEKYLALSIKWPFADTKPNLLQPVVGMLQYYDVAPEALLKCYWRFDAAVAATEPKQVPLLPRRSAGEKLRVGYVSGDFRRHVMGRIMADVIGAHDRSRFDITLVSLCEKQYQDDITQAFAREYDRFLDISTLTDLEAAAAIAEADLDILVDMAGHTMAARPSIYAHRPARRIVTHLGYHGTLGLSAVDYKITDEIADPPEMAQYQIEKPLYLDSCLFPFTHIASNPADDARYLQNKPAGKFLFGVFVNVMKLSSRCMAAWRKILEQTPNALLAFSPINPNDVPSIERVLLAENIPLSRLHIISASNVDSENRARYAAIDAVLDTFPYAGGDTTLAALDRDIPVITLCGKRNAERVGVSLLTHLGVTETIANTEQEYVSIACRVATDSAFRASVANAIKQARENTAMGKPATHTQSLERAYQRIAAETATSQASMSAAAFFTAFRDGVAMQSEAMLAELTADQPHYIPLLQARAQLAHRAGNTSAAMRHLNAILTVAPNDIDSILALASLAINAPKIPPEAELDDLLAKCSALPPQYLASAPVARMRARILIALGRFADAEVAIKTVTAVAAGDVESHFIHANILANLDRADEAIALFQRVLMLDPTHAAACVNAAQLLADRGEQTSAEALLRRAIEINPDDETVYLKLAPVLRSGKKWSALASLGKMMETRFPISLHVKLICAESARFNGDLEQESRQLTALADEICAINGKHDIVEEVTHAILARLAALDMDTARIERLTERYLLAIYSLYGRRTVTFTSKFDKTDPQSLRIGALVSDLADVARGDAIQRTLAPFAEAGCQCIIYALNAPPIAEFDQLVKRISPATLGVLLAGVSVDNARTQIKKGALDVLIDLTGHRHIAALPIMIHHDARITLSNGALATHTFGLRAYLPGDLDFELFDPHTALPIWQSRGPSRAMMAVSQLLPRARTSTSSAVIPRTFPQDVFVFALSTTLIMVSRETLQLARNIIERVPQMLLAVDASHEATLQVWQRIGQNMGIPANKIVPLPTADATRFTHVDAVLDACPGSDAVAVNEALVAAIPVITMKGPSAAERMGYSALAAWGLDELAADSGPDYVNLAVKLASDIAWREAIVAKIRRAALQPAAPDSSMDTIVAALRNLLTGMTST